MTGFISLSSACVKYGPSVAVRSLDLDVPEGAMVTLLGPSGCGKTTTLRTLAGLERLSGGELRIGGRLVDAPGSRTFVAPEKRNIGMVFQSYALWPQMSVRQNIAYPLRIRKVARAERTARVDELLEMLGLTPYADRAPSMLSGGQQQRVAIARALACDPQMLLFDEPLSNLDARLRRSLRSEIRSVHQRTGATSVFVTHDHEEALAISDKVAVMLDGDLVQFGDPVEVYRRPGSRRVAEFFGFDNIIDVTLDASGTVAVADGTGARLVLPTPETVGSAAAVLAVRRDQLHLLAPGDANRSRFTATVTGAAYVGGVTEFDVVHQGLALRCSVDDWTLGRLGRGIPAVGDEVELGLPTQGVAIFARDQHQAADVAAPEMMKAEVA